MLSADPVVKRQAAYWVACGRLAEAEEKYTDVIDIYKEATSVNAEVRFRERGRRKW